jgi:hypothetical protein
MAALLQQKCNYYSSSAGDNNNTNNNRMEFMYYASICKPCLTFVIKATAYHHLDMTFSTFRLLDLSKSILHGIKHLHGSN